MSTGSAGGGAGVRRYVTAATTSTAAAAGIHHSLRARRGAIGATVSSRRRSRRSATASRHSLHAARCASSAAVRSGVRVMLKPGLGQLWAGTAALGFAGTAGNAQTTTFTTAIGANRVTRTDKTTLYFNTIKASASVSGKKADTAEAVRGGWAYSHNLSSRLLINTFNDWEYDRFQSLDLRFVLGGGFGYIAYKGEKARLDLVGGVAYDHSKFSPTGKPEFSRNAANAYWGNDYTLKLSSATNLVQSFRMFNNLSDTGQYRVNFDVNANTKLSKWLTWTVGLSDRYLSNPVVGRKANDFLYTTGLGITFASK